MGANVSTQNSKSITSTVNDVLNSFSTSVQNDTSLSSSIEQTMNIRLINSNCGNINATQIASNKVSAMSKLSSQQQVDLSTQLENAVKTQLQQDVAQKNSGLNLGQANVSEQNTLIEQYLKNNVKNVVSATIKNSFSVNQSGVQVINFDMAGSTCNNLNITQDMVMEQMSSNIATNLQKGAVSAVLSNKAIAAAKTTATQTNAGLSFGLIFIIIALVFGVPYFGFSALMKYIIPLSILLTIILIIYMSQQSGANSPALEILIVLLVLEIIGTFIYYKYIRN